MNLIKRIVCSIIVLLYISMNVYADNRHLETISFSEKSSYQLSEYAECMSKEYIRYVFKGFLTGFISGSILAITPTILIAIEQLAEDPRTPELVELLAEIEQIMGTIIANILFLTVVIIAIIFTSSAQIAQFGLLGAIIGSLMFFIMLGDHCEM